MIMICFAVFSFFLAVLASTVLLRWQRVAPYAAVYNRQEKNTAIMVVSVFFSLFLGALTGSVLLQWQHVSTYTAAAVIMASITFGGTLTGYLLSRRTESENNKMTADRL